MPALVSFRLLGHPSHSSCSTTGIPANEGPQAWFGRCSVPLPGPQKYAKSWPKIMAFWAICRDFGPLCYILSGYR